ncbi:uncharacterized protein F4822DRAFT_416654 [Hypoxylon trugodes]|uniref:uncharacterized protein n=1 Tax=Hypoxylon trugodes TaxID=326681 RepID=UPI002190CC69|nr:uncharacterized protein F4822DRAFT_416654 [Hypoxylon trugodes]KAI1384903.1 hypothetical protein F4822DRAFT_416654 [Hypoxylon trugodes]
MAASGLYYSRPDYSNLEVVQNSDTLVQGHGLEVYSHNTDPEAVWVENDPNGLPIARPSSKEGKILTPASEPPEVLRDSHQNNGDPPPAPPPPPPTICGIRRRTFWIVVGVVSFVVVAAAVGGGVGGYYATHNSKDSSSASTYQNLSIAALHWVDGSNTSQYRVYYQLDNQTDIFESAWESDNHTWSVSAISDLNSNAKKGTPLAAAAGYPHTNTSNALVKNVYFAQPGGSMTERESPYKDQVGFWGDDNFSGLYTISNSSSLFSYWYQNFDTKLQVLAVFFQELGANSLTVAKYVQNNTDDEPWQKTQQSIAIQDGSSIAAAPVGSRRDLRLYIGGTDGTMKQYPYNIETNALGSATNTAYDLAPHTPICVTTEDNRNYFTPDTLPECAQTNTGAFITHLILFASIDRKNLTLVSWNCTSGFVDAQSRIEKLLRPNRTYLGLSTTSAANLTFVDDRVYVLYDEGNGAEIEEWQIPTSGGSDTTGQNGPWTSLGSVPVKPS